MHEKSNKIVVLRKMMPNDMSEPQLIVPQNSLTNLRHKMGLTEKKKTSASASSFNPMKNTIRKLHPANKICPHCENMAKNFLYLESLMRTNYNKKYQCSLCYSALKYLQYINMSILQVFGNSAPIVQAAGTLNTCMSPHQAREAGGFQPNPSRTIRRSKSKASSTVTKTSKKVATTNNTNCGVKIPLKNVKSTPQGVKVTSATPAQISTSNKSKACSKAQIKEKRKYSKHEMTTRMMLKKILNTRHKQTTYEKKKKSSKPKKNVSNNSHTVFDDKRKK